ncbi:unnamed protein product [Amaranthus hypochondriacus]
MASNPPSTTSSHNPPQFYYCYQCNGTVSISPSNDSSSELSCPNCNGGFLEEIDSPNPVSTPFSPFFSTPTSSTADQLAPFAPFLFPPPPSTSVDPIDLSSIFGASQPNPRSPFHDADVFNPLQFLQNYLQTMRAGGANIQFVIENSNPDQPGPNFRLPSNLGDYFFGPGLEQLIQQLAENDPNRYGTPPAAKTAVEGLPNVQVTQELLSSDSSQCAVCMDEFELGAQAKQMPCKHVFHSDCILPWLELHNSCPVCRYELPTDDPDYEQRARGGRSNPGSDGNGNRDGNDDGGSQAGSSNDRTVERRFRISLPWPFGAAASTAEGSNDVNSGSQSNPRRENPDSGSETRYEDLD